ncbi:DUF4232 domain-containing protein [Arthrobacter gandavensis]|uniref:DUF4232 domain-containing protein n=1 Tax=Arthrobacter gandavensis TaxID=169960 RepID=UPI00188E5BA5|nr:DUF4232 domain-containing protein [Arthrobacter gandavensis]MBF4994159.1 DUF4232 domain-containing protein [Arthrobacter gandavensis]
MANLGGGETGEPSADEPGSRHSEAEDDRARQTRLLAAALAGALWVASGTLASVLAALPQAPELTWVVFPRTVELSPGAGLSGPPPGDHWVAALAGAVLVSALTVMLLRRLARRRTVPWLSPLQASWLCIILASAAGSGSLGLRGLLVGWPPEQPEFLVGSLVPPVTAGIYWGFLWGWLPALAAARHANPSTVPAVSGSALRIGGRFFVPLAAAVLAGTAALAFLPSWQPPGPLEEREYVPEAAAPPGPQPVQDPEPVVIGAPEFGHAFEEPDPAWCTGDEVRMGIDGFDAALGSRGARITLEVTGSRSCVVHAYPDLDFNRTDGWVMDITAVHGGSMMTTDTGHQDPFIIEPGQFAEAGIGWRATAGAGMSRVGTLLVAPYSGTLRQSLAVDFDLTEPGFLTVTSWTPAGPGAPPPGSLPIP